MAEVTLSIGLNLIFILLFFVIKLSIAFFDSLLLYSKFSETTGF